MTSPRQTVITYQETNFTLMCGRKFQEISPKEFYKSVMVPELCNIYHGWYIVFLPAVTFVTWSVLLIIIFRSVPEGLIHLFISWYSVSASIVCWRGVSSEQYELESGVRQGGVISPVLFAIYINNLIVKIQNSKLGCHINCVPMSIFMFADDLVLVVSSLIHLRIMIEICQCELDEIDMKLNVGKTQCIVFGKHFLRVRPNLVINGNEITWLRTVTYLGVTFKSSSNLQVDVKNRRSKFYQSFNSIFSRASKSGDTVLLSLLVSR